MAFSGRRMAVAADETGGPDNSLSVARRLVGYLLPHWPQLLILLLTVLVSAGASALGPLFIGQAIDNFIVPGDRDGLMRTMLFLIGVYVVGAAATGAQFYLMGRVGQEVLAQIRDEIFNKIQALSLSYFDKNESGDLMSRLTNDVDTLNQFLGQGLIQVVGGIFQMIAIAIAMLTLQWQLGLAVLAVLPLMLFTTLLISRRARVAFRDTREVLGDISAELEEGIAGVKVAQAFNRADENISRFHTMNEANRDANVSAVAITSTLSPAMSIFNALATAIVAGLGGYLALQGRLSVGLVVSYLQYVQQFFRPVQQIGQFWGQAQAALAGADRIFELLDIPLELTDRADALPMPSIEGDVVFHNVSFAYKPGEPVLQEITLLAKPGQTVALVGATGAGKSTIISLIPRFYEVTTGAITIDGIDIRTVERASLRQQIGLVLQDNFLFSGTVTDNIRYGRLEATDEEVEASARIVSVHEVILQLPEGYQTELGERGGALSQGQRQLISFARAVLADPRILILDEATSNIDTHTEQLIQTALEILLAKRTSFVIAHRLSTITKADQILVLEQGRIVERAERTATASAHELLLDKAGAYAQLYNRQFQEQADPAEDNVNGHYPAAEAALAA